MNRKLKNFLIGCYIGAVVAGLHLINIPGMVD